MKVTSICHTNIYECTFFVHTMTHNNRIISLRILIAIRTNIFNCTVCIVNYHSHSLRLKKSDLSEAG